MARRKQRFGIGLIDLLVTLIAGTIVFALALPALQRTRETARAVDCKDRLVKIALAVHNFHDAFTRLPPGTLNYETPPNGVAQARATPGFSSEECQNLSALFLILPLMEPAKGDEFGTNEMYESVDGRLADLKKDLRQITDASQPPKRIFNSQLRYGPGAGEHWPTDSYIQRLYECDMEPAGTATDHVPAFNCPADTPGNVSELPSIAITMPYYNGTSLYSTPLDDLLYVTFKDMNLGKTNYVAVAGTTSCFNVPSRLAKWAGAMTGRPAMTLEMVANLDGSAGTFMFGESLGDVGGIAKLTEKGELDGVNDFKEIKSGKRGITRSWIWGGLGILASSNFPWACMQHPELMEPEREGAYLKLLGDSALADPESFSSAHVDGVNFAMVDGSAHTVPRDIRWQLYYGNGGLRDGIAERGF